MANVEAFESGFQSAVGASQARRQRKEMLADQDRQHKFLDYHEQREGLRSQLLALQQAKVPENDKRYIDANKALADTQLKIDLLFDPIHAPGALQRNWPFLQGVISRKILRRKPQAGAEPVPVAEAPAELPTVKVGFEGKEIPLLHHALGPDDPFSSDMPPEATQQAAVQAITQPPVAATPQHQPSRYERKMQAAREKAAQEAGQYLTAGRGPSPEEQAQVKTRMEDAETTELFDSANQNWDRVNPHATDAQRLEAHNDNFQRIVLGVTGINRGTVKPESLTLTDGTVVAAQRDPDGVWTYLNREPIPMNLLGKGAKVTPKPKNKIKAGTAIPSEQSDTKWAQIWVDPSDPGNKSLWSWTPAMPSRGLQTTTSESATTDALTGLVTRNIRTTGPANRPNFDLSGIGQTTEAEVAGSSPDTGTPQPAPATPTQSAAPAHPAAASSASPQQLRRQVPAQPVVTNPTAPVATYGNPLPLDGDKHIPVEAKPANLNELQWDVIRTAANRLLDGAMPKDLGDNQKVSAIAQGLAQKYGWSVGLFTPKEQLLIREAGTYLKDMRDKGNLKVLENYWSRQKIHNGIKAADGAGGIFTDQMALTFGLSRTEADFVQRFLQVRGVVGGLTQLSRGGRTTEAGIKRLQSELPDPLTVHTAKDAKRRLDMLLSEIDVAQKQGFVADLAPDSKGGVTQETGAKKQQIQQLLNQVQQVQGGAIVYKGDDTPMRYNGTGAMDDWNNYTEVRPQ